MKSLHLFAGIGGGILADKILGSEVVGAVEIEPYCRALLKQKQERGLLENFPIFEDVRDFNGDEFKKQYGAVDVVCGGFPCQDISSAGRGAGITGEKSSLFFELARVVGELSPRYVFLENSPRIRTRGLDRVLCRLAELGFDAEWSNLSAGGLEPLIIASGGGPYVNGKTSRLKKSSETSPRSRRDGALTIAQHLEAGAYPTVTANCSSSHRATTAQLERTTPRLDVHVDLVERLPTPRCHDSKAMSKAELLRKSPSLAAIVELLTPGGGKLSPTWVAWLMNIPDGWTRLKD